ncbi:hypothetical protein KSF73_16870 [Burkholderiaceae bacterium DAT-1]|nr:hypothetical protein [Burkholderiaceae bacterium DAT-1]
MAPGLPGVSISAPTDGFELQASTGNPTPSVTVSGTASAPGCGATITQMQVVVDGSVVYSTAGATVSTPIALSEGQHQIWLTTTDSFGGTTVSRKVLGNVVKAPTAPVVSLDNPSNNATIARTLTVSGKATPSSGRIVKAALVVDGTAYATQDLSGSMGQPSPYSFSVTDLAVGNHTLEVQAWDSQNLMGSSGKSTVTVAGKPVVTLDIANSMQYLPQGSTQQATFAIKASATQTGASISKLDLVVDNVISYTANAASLTSAWALPLGTHKVEVWATDSLGNVGYSRQIGVNSVIAPLPTVSLTDPSDNLTVRKPDTLGMRAVTNAYGGAEFKYYLDGPGGTGQYLGVQDRFDFAGAGIRSQATETFIPGQYAAYVIVKDGAGQQVQSAKVKINISATPVVSISEPANNTVLAQGGTVTVKGSASEAYGRISKFSLIVDGKEYPQTGSGLQNQAYAINVPSPTLSGGEHLLSVKVWDDFDGVAISPDIKVKVAQKPTLQVNRTPSTMLSNYSYTSTWSTTDADSVTLTCTASAGGYAVTNLSLAPNGSVTDTAKAEWVGKPSSCTWTATGAGGSAQYTETLTTIAGAPGINGEVSGVYISADGKTFVEGWVCQKGQNQAIGYKVFVGAQPDANATALGAGKASALSNDVSTSTTTANLATACGDGLGHYFKHELTSLTGYNAATVYVQAVPVTSGASPNLPCTGSCQLTAGATIGFSTPKNGQTYGGGNVFMSTQVGGVPAGATVTAVRMQVGTQAAITAQADSSLGAGFYSTTTTLAKGTYVIKTMADLRLANGTVTTLTSAPITINVIEAGAINLAVSAPATIPSAPASFNVSINATGASMGSIASVKVTVGQGSTTVVSGSATGSNGNYTYAVSNLAAGTYQITATAQDSSGGILMTSPVQTVVVPAGSGGGTGGASDATPKAVTITPPGLNNADAGTLPGELTIQNGAAIYSLPIAVPPATAGMQPALNLSYNSHAPNGYLGLGWTLGGLSTIHRCAKTIAQDGQTWRINFDKADRLCIDGKRLVRVNDPQPNSGNSADVDEAYWKTGGEFRTEIDDFSRITMLTNSQSEPYFKVETRDGRTHYYGSDPSSFINFTNNNANGLRFKALLWALGKVEDRFGNYMTFTYTNDSTTGEYLPSSIKYGGNSVAGQTPDLMIQFKYESRDDISLQYIGGARNDVRSRLTNIQVLSDVKSDGTGGGMVQDYAIHYTYSPTSGRSLIDYVQLSALNQATQKMDMLPKTTFDWGNTTDISWKYKRAMIVPLEETRNYRGNLDGSGRPTLIAAKTTIRCGFSADVECPKQPPISDEKKEWTGKNVLTGEISLVLPDGRKFDKQLTMSRVWTGSTALSTGIKSGVSTLFIGDLDGDGIDDIAMVSSYAIGNKVFAVCFSRPKVNGEPDFDCSGGGPVANMTADSWEDSLPTLVDMDNDRKMEFLYGLSDKYKSKSCSYNNASKLFDCKDVLGKFIGGPVQSNPFTQMLFNPVPIHSSRYDMTDFYSVWSNRSKMTSGTTQGVTVCTNKGTIDCQTIFFASVTQPSNPAFALPAISSGATVGSLTGSGLTDFVFYTWPYTWDFGGGNSVSTPPDYPPGTIMPAGGKGASRFICLSTEVGVDCWGEPLTVDAASSEAIGGSIGDPIGDGLNRFWGSKGLCVLNDRTLKCKGTSNTLESVIGKGVKYRLPRGLEDLQVLDSAGIQEQVIIREDAYQAAYNASLKTVSAEVYSLAGPANLDKVITITNGVGAQEKLEYARSNDSSVYSQFPIEGGLAKRPTYPLTSVPPGVLVSSYKKANGSGGWVTTSYSYAGYYVDASGRGAAGFASIITTQDQLGTQTLTSFRQDWPFVGMPRTAKVVATKNSNVVLSDTTYNYATLTQTFTSGGQSVFPYLASSTSEKKDLDGTAISKTETSNTYDDWGNLTSSSVKETKTADTASYFTTETTSTFDNSNNGGNGYNTKDASCVTGGSGWIVGRVCATKITRSSPRRDGTRLSLSRNTSFKYGSKGELTSQTIEPGTDLEVVTSYDRSGNSFGLVNTTTQSWAYDKNDGQTVFNSQNGKEVRSMSTGYDAKGRFATSVTNAVGMVETRSFDAATGAMLCSTDANGLVTRATVNGFGRVLTQTAPGKSTTCSDSSTGNQTRSYVKQCNGDCPANAKVIQITMHYNGNSQITVPTLAYLDAAGHTLRTVTYGFDGSLIARDQVYDDLGRLKETYQAATISAITDAMPVGKLASRQTYDNLNRVTTVTTLDTSGNEVSATTEYAGLVRKLTNAKGQKRSETRDAWNRLMQVDTVRMANDLANANTDTTTKFDYDPFGNLIQTIDPIGATISVEYDNLGRKTKLVDPDLGTIQYWVDPVGRTWKQQSPNQKAAGTATTMQFDLLDRMTKRVEDKLTSTFVYDTTNATGGVLSGSQLATCKAAASCGKQVERYTGTATTKDVDVTQTYTTLGLPLQTTTTLDVASKLVFTAKTDYDDWNRPITQTYQRGTDSSKVFGQRYNDKGYLSQMLRGNTVLWESKVQDAANRVIQAALGNGVVDTRCYNAHTGWLNGASITSLANAPASSNPCGTVPAKILLGEDYTYDVLGNVNNRTEQWNTGITGSVPTQYYSESFSYDGLNRIIQSSVTGTQTSNVPQVFSYTLDGSIASKSGMGSYTYVPNTHKLKNISGVSGDFSFDDNGNQLTGNGRTTTWTSFDMPDTISRNNSTSQFTYGPDHERRSQTTGSSITFYGGAQEVITDKNRTVQTIKTYWPMGLGVEIDKAGQATELNYTHADRLGSLVAITDAAGNLKEGMAFDAWGSRRLLAGTPVTATSTQVKETTDNKGYTGQEMLDDLELVHLNGRVYDPLVGKFLSGDPLIADPVNGQNYNRFSYVLNNPTNLTDPSGFEVVDDVRKLAPLREPQLQRVSPIEVTACLACATTQSHVLSTYDRMWGMQRASAYSWQMAAKQVGGQALRYIASTTVRVAVASFSLLLVSSNFNQDGCHGGDLCAIDPVTGELTHEAYLKQTEDRKKEKLAREEALGKGGDAPSSGADEGKKASDDGVKGLTNGLEHETDKRGRPVKGHYVKPGGDAQKDLDSLPGTDAGKGQKTLPDGSSAGVHTSRTTGAQTLHINRPEGSQDIKIRYPEAE